MFLKKKKAYEVLFILVGSEMFIRDSPSGLTDFARGGGSGWVVGRGVSFCSKGQGVRGTYIGSRYCSRFWFMGHSPDCGWIVKREEEGRWRKEARWTGREEEGRGWGRRMGRKGKGREACPGVALDAVVCQGYVGSFAVVDAEEDETCLSYTEEGGEEESY